MEFTAEDYDMPHEKAWCPGCGHFTAQKVLRNALADLQWKPKDLVFVSGIGQAAKLPQYTKGNMFNGLHGRSLPAAMAIKASNPNLHVIVNSGDGCTYGEGGNHLMAQMARNADLTVFAHNNMIYGLTKGQASPTSQKGLKTPVQVFGVTNEPYNPIAIGLAMGATFIGRVFAGEMEYAKIIFRQALQHKGFALVDVFVQCVSMNKINSFKWYKDHIYHLEDDYDPTDINAAWKKAHEKDKFPTGIIYKQTEKPTFWETSVAYADNPQPLYARELNKEKLKQVINAKRH